MSGRLQDFDASGLSCLEQARTLYNAYFALSTGRRAVRVVYDNYTVEYRPLMQGDVAQLRDLYMRIRNGCAEAQTLPDLSEGTRVRRGPPIWGTIGR